MGIFSTKNVRNVIVLNSEFETAGDKGAFIGVVEVPGLEDAFYLKYTNALGDTVKSDLIYKNKIRFAKSNPATPAVLRTDTVTIGTPVAGQDYIIRIVFREWGSGSPENQYIKHVGAVKATSTMTDAQLAAALADVATKNFVHEASATLKFEATNEVLTITELEQPFVLGKRSGKPLNYVIQLVPITVSGVDIYDWATIETTYANTGIGTYKQAAELEYFYHGEIGDMYRQVGYPYTWNTQYLVEKDATYDILDIAFFDNFEADSVQAAEKQLVILCKLGDGGVHTLANTVISGINDISSGLITELEEPEEEPEG